MKKITLNVEALAVESFETLAEESGRGTVLAHEPTRAGPNCGDGSIADNCVTGLCTYDCPETYAPAACPTAYPEYC